MEPTRVIKVLYVVILVLAGLLLVSPFFIPIVFGATLSLALFPLLLKLEKLGLPRKWAALLVTTIFTFIISIPLFFFAIKGTLAVTHQLEKFSQSERYQGQGVQEIVVDLRRAVVISVKKFSAKYEFLDFLDEKKINEYINSLNDFLLQFFRTTASSVPQLFLILLVMLLCLYICLKYADPIRDFFKEITGFSEERIDTLSKLYIRASRQVYLSNLITGSVQSLIVASSVALLNQGEFFIVFFVTLILSFIPVIGAAPVAFVFGILAFLRDQTTAAIILAVVGTVTGLVDNILRPWLASFGESKIPPGVAFICVIGGALLLGFPGLFIGLLLGSYAYDTLPIFWQELKTKKSSHLP